MVQTTFRLTKNLDEAHAEQLDQAFRGLRVLLEQLYLEKCSSSCTTEGVTVDATSHFSHSSQSQGRPQHIFTYRIRVTNLRTDNIQVLGREWTIKNDRGQAVVHIPLTHGNAVVGQQPVIPPGTAFEYFSGTDLDTPSGLQEGKLEVALLEPGGLKPGRIIHATVKPFAHLMPGLQTV